MADGVDVLVAGAGLAGAVTARVLAESHGLRVAVVERRGHVGGLCHDAVDAAGVRVPSYGPHYFRTGSPRVRAFLDRFTAWHEVAFRVVARARGRDWSFPVNLRTFEQWLGRPSTTAEMEATLASWRVPCEAPADSEAFVLARAGRPFFELFYEGYTRKQWGREARELRPSACGRVPLRTDRDDRYLSAPFQAMPADGYTAMFDRILDHPGIRVSLRADAREAATQVPHRHRVWTGPVDDFFDRAHATLPWRSLRWEREVLASDADVLPAPQVNFPDPDVPWTRLLEPRQLPGPRGPLTTILREFPEPAGPGRDPFYAVPAADAEAAHRPYALRAAASAGVTFVGRLATYRNLDMDQVVEDALDAAAAIAAALRSGPL